MAIQSMHPDAPAQRRLLIAKPSSRGFRAVVIWTLWLWMPSFWLAQDSQAQSDATATRSTIPLWQQGFSTWTGSGYEMPLPSATSDNSASGTSQTISRVYPFDAPYEAPTQINPYTMPTDSNGRPANPNARLNDSTGIPRIGGVPKVEFEPSLTWPSRLNMKVESDLTLGGAEWLQAAGSQQEPAAKKQAGSAAASEQAAAETKPAAKTPPASKQVVEELPAPTSTAKAKSDSKPTISEQLDEGKTADQPPLQQEVTRWYQYPWRWITKGWANHAEFGLDGSNGNADTLAIQTGIELKRKTDDDTLAIDVDYRQASNRGLTTEDNGRFNVDYDRLVGNSSWSSFGKFGIEWDRFKNFDLRLNLHGGVGYYWLRDDRSTFATRFGAGAMRKIGAPLNDDWFAEALFGIEAERQLSNRQKIKARVDYFPTWEDFNNYRLVSDASWEMLLDNSENLSLRLAATDRYDSSPQGAKPNDVYYSMLLLYKF